MVSYAEEMKKEAEIAHRLKQNQRVKQSRKAKRDRIANQQQAQALLDEGNRLLAARREQQQHRAERAARAALPMPKQRLRQKFKAASYSDGAMDLPRLFEHYDRDNSGEMDFDEFRRAVRKDGKITKAEVSDKALRKLFDDADTDKGGSIGLDEFVSLLQDEDEPELLGSEGDTEIDAMAVGEAAKTAFADGLARLRADEGDLALQRDPKALLERGALRSELETGLAAARKLLANELGNTNLRSPKRQPQQSRLRSPRQQQRRSPRRSGATAASRSPVLLAPGPTSEWARAPPRAISPKFEPSPAKASPARRKKKKTKKKKVAKTRKPGSNGGGSSQRRRGESSASSVGYSDDDSDAYDYSDATVDSLSEDGDAVETPRQKKRTPTGGAMSSSRSSTAAAAAASRAAWETAMLDESLLRLRAAAAPYPAAAAAARQTAEMEQPVDRDPAAGGQAGGGRSHSRSRSPGATSAAAAWEDALRSTSPQLVVSAAVRAAQATADELREPPATDSEQAGLQRQTSTARRKQMMAARFSSLKPELESQEDDLRQ